jgi:hypothetical protein
MLPESFAGGALAGDTQKRKIPCFPLLKSIANISAFPIGSLDLPAKKRHSG